eukprot:362568-Pyramimonas_sp.AAC.1
MLGGVAPSRPSRTSSEKAYVWPPFSPHKWTPALAHFHCRASAAVSLGIGSAEACIIMECLLPQSAPSSGLAARPFARRAEASRDATHVARTAA